MYNYDELLGRMGIFEDIKQKLSTINQPGMKNNKGFYIYGNSGIGKTEFVKRLLTSLNYDIITYDAGDFRSKTVLESITKNGMSDKNVSSMFSKKQSIAIIMDEIDGMNSGDKGGINTLIKIIRDKKTKKQKTEDMASCPIICIGNYHIDKKIKELMKVCNTYELTTPTNDNIKNILIHLMPSIVNCEKVMRSILLYINCDLRKLTFIQKLYMSSPDIINDETFYGCSSILNIIIPTTITSIGVRAFYDCSSITSFTIPTSIGGILFDFHYHFGVRYINPKVDPIVIDMTYFYDKPPKKSEKVSKSHTRKRCHKKIILETMPQNIIDEIEADTTPEFFPIDPNEKRVYFHKTIQIPVMTESSLIGTNQHQTCHFQNNTKI